MTPAEWARVVEVWARLWPYRPLPPEAVTAWGTLLADLDGDAVQTALVVWASRVGGDGWPPQTPGQLRAAVDPPRPWHDAIGELAATVRRVGWAGRPTFDDPALGEVVASLGGWASLCATFDPTDPATRAQFRDAYREASQARRTLEATDRARLLTGRRTELT